MQLIEDLEELFERNGYQWLVKGGQVVPDRYDFELFLEQAVKTLATEPVGTRLTSGRLIIEKTEYGHEVYALMGVYT